MSGQNRQQSRQRSRNGSRPSWWAGLEQAVSKVCLRGNRQRDLVDLIRRMGCGEYPNRGIFISRQELARKLGLPDADWKGRNTGRRERRCQELGLFILVQGGGRLRNRNGRYRGRATRIYPGPEVYPNQQLVRQAIVQDDADEEARSAPRPLAPRTEEDPPAPASERPTDPFPRIRGPG